MRYIIAAVSGYVFGSVSFSILISKMFHKKDIRDQGSSNAGATNMARTYGLSAGLETMSGDMLKTILALANGYMILGNIGLAISGMACLLGHCYPVFYDFKGGKGVSAGAVIAFAVSPICFAVSIATFLLMAFVTKKVSAGSLAAAAVLSVSAAILSVPRELLILAVFTSAVIIIRHRANIGRLIRGEEKDFRIPRSKR